MVHRGDRSRAQVAIRLGDKNRPVQRESNEHNRDFSLSRRPYKNEFDALIGQESIKLETVGKMRPNYG